MPLSAVRLGCSWVSERLHIGLIAGKSGAFEKVFDGFWIQPHEIAELVDGDELVFCFLSFLRIALSNLRA